MSCENKLTNLIFKSKEKSAKTQFASFFFLFFKLKNRKNTKNEMYECYAMQILKTRRKHKNQRTMVTKGIAKKHKDYVRKTQLDRVFCIQNLLDAPRALEFVFTLE